MIFFYGEGRLGNQVFQYQALARIAKEGERVYAVGLEDVRRVLELRGPRVSVITASLTLKRIVKYVLNPLILRPLARTLRLFNYVYEPTEGAPPHDGPAGSLLIQKGVLQRLTFVDGGFYQDPALWEAVCPAQNLLVPPELRARARKYLEFECKGNRRPTFVHVRRGDYKTFHTHGLSDLALPREFYLRAIQELESRIGSTHLVFVTDDPTWVEEQFRKIGNKSIASFDAVMDFAVMTECGSAILSNSTFSLAAALLMNGPEIVIGPRFWFGFRVGQWVPSRVRVQHERFVYTPVLQESTQS
jgi:hypothetical protein